MSSKYKMAASILFQGLQFFCGRENSCASVLRSFKDWATTNLLTNKPGQFVSLCEEGCN